MKPELNHMTKKAQTVVLWVWLKRREEPQLEQRFGDAYRVYRETTPLIIPRPWRGAKKAREKET